MKYLAPRTHPSVRPHNAPKISFKELCFEFGISAPKLAQALSHKEAPKPVLILRSGTVNNTWFEPKDVRKWWNERQA